MGEGITKSIDTDNAEIIRRKREFIKQRTANSATSASTATAEAKGEVGGRSGNGTNGKDGDKKAEQDISGLSVLTTGKTTEIELKEDIPKQDKPKRTRKAKVNKNDATLLINLLSGISTIVSSREGFEHWALDEKEIEAICNPLNAILIEHDFYNKITNNSNEIALATACVSIFVPRVMMSVSIKKAKKVTKINGGVKSGNSLPSDRNRTENNKAETTPSVENADGKNNKQSAARMSNNGNITFKDAVEYGLPIL